MTDQQIRNAVRLIVVSDDNHVLLLRYQRHSGEGSSSWVPPGGAIEPGETHLKAARRELREETGIDAEICKELWDLDFEFEVHGESVRQFEKYFLVEAGTGKQQLQNSSPEPILEHRWWSIDDLANTENLVYPAGLADRLHAEIAD